jgi:long-chain acyl-CoA synthetase
MSEHDFIKLDETSCREHWDLPALSDYQGSTFTYGDVATQVDLVWLKI